jgi:hypothetical protein
MAAIAANTRYLTRSGWADGAGITPAVFVIASPDLADLPQVIAIMSEAAAVEKPRIRAAIDTPIC